MHGWKGRRGAGSLALGAFLALAAGCGEAVEPGWWEGQPVLGLVRVTDSVPASSERERTASVRCPADKKALSGGGRIAGGDGEVRLAEMAPAESGSAYRVRAVEDPDGHKGRWSLEVYVLCANPLIGLHHVSEPDRVLVDAAADARARCKEGQAVVGGGVDIPDTEDVVAHFGFNLDHHAVSSVAADAVGVHGAPRPSVDLTVHAVCADPIGWLTAESDSVTGGPATGTLTLDVKCPEDRSLLGADARAGVHHRYTGVVPAPDLAVTSIWAAPDLRSATVTAHRLARSTGDWTLAGTALCATALP